MSQPRRARRCAGAAIALACAASCTSGGEQTGASNTQAGQAVSETSAVVRVSTVGTYVTPDFGQIDSTAGSGSGFVIDESGLVVTNNHVVAGAGIVEVYLDNSDTPIPASVVGTSECSDLAVLDMEGGGYESLAWADTPATRGSLVTALGYPGATLQSSITEGIVADADDPGDTAWAAVVSLLRHDADIEPGSSGGPLLDTDGRVVGVNTAASASARYSIPASIARPIVEQLIAGQLIDSIGVNAVAVNDDVSNESGVWVVSVAAGSAADDLGLRPGDIISRTNGIRVGLDGTLADYCSAIRTAAGGPVDLEVTRATDLLAGTIGGQALAPVLSDLDPLVQRTPAVASAPVEADPPVPPPAGEPYVAYRAVSDQTETFSIDVPTVWADTDTSPILVVGKPRAAIQASTDISAYDRRRYDIPSVGAVIYDGDVLLDVAYDLIAQVSPWTSDCTPGPVASFDDGTYQGVSQTFIGCTPEGAAVVSTMIRRFPDRRYLHLVVYAASTADIDAAQRMLTTFTINPDPDGQTVTGVQSAPADIDHAPVVVEIADSVGLPGGAKAELYGTYQSARSIRRTHTFDQELTESAFEEWTEAAAETLDCEPTPVRAGEGVTCDVIRGDSSYRVALTGSLGLYSVVDVRVTVVG